MSIEINGTKVKVTLHKPSDHPQPGTVVKAFLRNNITGLEFIYPFEWTGDHWLARRAKEQRGFDGGVTFMGWYE